MDKRGYNADMAKKNAPLDIEAHPVDEYRDKQGRMVKPLPTPSPITHANARQMQQKSAIARRNRAMQQAQQRTLRELAAIEPTVTSWADAWGELVAKQAVMLHESDKPRGDDLLRIGQALGAVPLSGETRDTGGGSEASTISELAALVREVATAARQVQKQTPAPVVIDAE